MGMNKSGVSNVPATWGKITGWVVRPGFTNSVANDRLTSNGSGTVVVKFKGTFEYTLGTQQVRVYLNGAPVGTATNNEVEGTVNLTLNPGDYIELWGMATSPGFEEIDPTATYVYFTAP
ncbi:hypothetical protein ACWDYH_00170 [Nocardia goodfellowii]